VLDVAAASLHTLVVNLDADYREPGTREHLRDPGTLHSETDHANSPELTTHRNLQGRVLPSGNPPCLADRSK
jgi:hypothetical protein